MSAVEDARSRVHDARSDYYREAVAASVSRETHLSLAVSLVQYHDVLLSHQDEGGPEFPYQADLLSRVGETVERVEELPGRGRGKRVTDAPAVLEIPPADLVDISHELDKFAHEAGLLPGVVFR